MVDDAIDILYSENKSLDEFGELLNESWKIKRALTEKISNEYIDTVYSCGIKGGAIGGKLLGAGGGGFIAFYVSPEKKENLINKMSDHCMYHFILIKWDHT